MIIFRQPNLIRELYDNKLIKHNLFSLCLGSNAGYFSVGKINKTFHNVNSSIVYLNRNPNNFFYSVDLNKIYLNGSEINTNYNTILDSGTTYSLFPQEIYDSLIFAFDGFLKKNEFPATKTMVNDDYCFQLNQNKTNRNLYKSLPSFHFNFENKYSIPWKPKNYLVQQVDDVKGVIYCLGFSIFK